MRERERKLNQNSKRDGLMRKGEGRKGKKEISLD